MDVLVTLITEIVEGGQGAIVAILVLVLLIVLFFLRLAHSSLKAKEILLEKRSTRNEKLLENYYEANQKVTEALNSVQIALLEIKSKL